jgi:CRISPR/Cas system-associated endonuclease Cas1
MLGLVRIVFTPIFMSASGPDGVGEKPRQARSGRLTMQAPIFMSASMSRPRCDGFDAAEAREAIAGGRATARQAYEVYCATAARPYARSTWELLLRRPEPVESVAREIVAPWRDITPVKPARVLTAMSDRASLKVRGGALIVTDDDRALVYEARGVKPLAIVMAGWAGFVTIEAMRFCSDFKIAIIILDWTRDFMTVVAPPARQSANWIRRQAAADPLPIAKALIRAKVEAHAEAGAFDQSICVRAISRLSAASSLTHVLMAEAQAARSAWMRYDVILRWREAGAIPKSWKLPYGARRRMSGKSARRATDPINALLNLALAVTIGRLAVALCARGLSPAIGILHQTPQWALAYDVIEPLRPYIEAATFRFISAHKFAPSDFILVNDGQVKTDSTLSRAFLEAAAAPQSEVDAAVTHFCRLIRT